MQSGWVKLAILTTVLGVAAALPSCGGDDDDDDMPGAGNAGVSGSGTSGSSGRGGSGTAGSSGGSAGDDSGPIPCGDTVCTPSAAGPTFSIPACCFDAATSQCGVDTSLLAGFGITPSQPCEPLDQPGDPDSSCPPSEPLMLGMTNLPAFQGCCRETGQCGYLINQVGGIIPIGLGCVDAAPFLDGGTPTACGSGAGGAGNTGGGGEGGG